MNYTNYALIFSRQKIEPEEIVQHPGKYVVIFRPTMLSFLRSKMQVPSANVITSIWKEYEKDSKQFFDWVDAQGYSRRHIHTSGHASKEALQEIADFIRPNKIIPIHTQNKEIFISTFKQEVLILEDNEPFQL
jgi:ribonuclease J